MNTINKNNLSEKFKSEKQVEMDKMQEVLTSIASEMQRFHDCTFESESDIPIFGCKEKQNVFGELIKCKSKMRSKRMCIKKLKKNLETACSVAKMVASAKEKETGCLKKSLGTAQSKFTDLMEKYENNKQLINSLTRENALLNNKLDNLTNFVRLGYEELQKIREEPAEETSLLERLRKLIVCCGQYYADYCNEHGECLHLKQRNSFLTNKSQILQGNIDSLSEQLETLQYRYLKLQKQNDLLKSKSNQTEQNDLGFSLTQVRIKSSSKLSDDNNDVDCNIDCSRSQCKLNYENGFDLSSHLSMVNKLLVSQDTLLQDLKSLSQDFLNHNNNH